MDLALPLLSLVQALVVDLMLKYLTVPIIH
jgi:hypothetical protein